MTTAPISTQIIPRQSSTLQESPLTIIMAIPRTDFVPNVNVAVSIDPDDGFPVGELTEITSSRANGLGPVASRKPRDANPHGKGRLRLHRGRRQRPRVRPPV